MGTAMPVVPETAARAEIVVDLGAIRRNVVRLRELTATDLPTGAAAPALMVVVKADGYGHGMVQSARAARAAGAEWLGVATADEGLALRAAGDEGRLLSWLAVPGEDLGAAIAADIDVTAYSVAQLGQILAVSGDRRPRVHLTVDTGLSRGGAAPDDWRTLFEAARAAEVAGDLSVVGLWSHLACSDEPDHPANDRQEAVFREAVRLAGEAGLAPVVRHLANSAAAVLRPSSRFDLVRVGIATYGLSPAPAVVSADELGLVPAMTVRGHIAMG
jgi:alanine racemase